MDAQLPVPAVANWRRLYRPGARCRCIKDSPPMRGFGRDLKAGDEVEVQSLCWDGAYEVSVAAECAFYRFEGYFEVIDCEEETP